MGFSSKYNIDKSMILAHRNALNRTGLRILGQIISLSGLLSALYAAPACADELSDVNKLVRTGQFGEAINKADAFLLQHPRDAQMRFLKGLILTEQNKPAEAIAAFTKLTEDFPNLPEPYNNLAVLFASSGQYEKARAALEMAIRTNPTYATAQENLGDVYAKLASQAYDKALQLDSANTGAKSKLTLVRTLIGNTTGGTNPKVVATNAGPATTKPVAAPVIIATPVAPTTIIATAKQEPAKVAPKTEVVAKVDLAKAPSKAEIKPLEKPTPKPENNGDLEKQAVLTVIDGWAKAWSTQDMKDYLGYYGNDFQTPKGISRKAWADERHARIEGKNKIDIKIESPQVAVAGNTATVKFRQSYISNRFTANSRKTLVLMKQGGKWQIQQERTGS
jgi:Flp pilus assembly protein TadD/ketosteroid isomerase-like protein